MDCVEDFVFLCKNALKINFRRIDGHPTYFYRQLPTGSSHSFKARNRIMAETLNNMVGIYPPEVLCPQIAAISDPALREQEFYKYLMTTFYKHAKGNMVRYSDYFQKYADYYRHKFLIIEGKKVAVGFPDGMADEDILVDTR